MKKLQLFILCIFMIMPLIGCAKTQAPKESAPGKNDVTANSDIVEQDSIEDSSVNDSDDIEDSSVNNIEEKKYSENKEINDFLNGKNPEKKLKDIMLPDAYEYIINELVDWELVTTRSYIQDYNINIIHDGDINSLESIMQVVPANRVALLAHSQPWYDIGQFSSSFNIVEQIFGHKIEWARSTGVMAPNSDAERLYTIMKAETGGYIYIFFDKLPEEYRLKFILYAERLYDESEFENFQVGDSIEKVAQIDSSCAFLYNNFSGVYPLTKYYYTQDDVIRIDFEHKKIKSIKHVGYTFPNTGVLATVDSRIYDLTILPQDFPPVE